MQEQLKLFAKMQLCKSNFQMLHWKSIGDEFDKFHTDVTASYYEKLDKDIDDVAEILMRQGVNPLNYFEVAVQLGKSGEKGKVLDSSQNYTKEQIIHCTDVLLRDIMEQILICLDSDEIKNVRENVGIKSYYESLYNEYDKECRFLNRRRGA